MNMGHAATVCEGKMQDMMDIHDRIWVAKVKSTTYSKAHSLGKNHGDVSGAP